MSVAASTPKDLGPVANSRSANAALIDPIAQALTAAALVGTGLAIAWMIALAVNWYSHPFFGALTSNTLVVTSADSVTPNAWRALQTGIRPFDRVLRLKGAETHNVPNFVEFDGQPDASTLLNATMARLTEGEQITVQIARAVSPNSPKIDCPSVSVTSDGVVCEYQFRVFQLPANDMFAQFGIPLIVAVILFAIGFGMFILRRRQGTARQLVVLCAALAVIAITRFDLATTFQTGLLFELAICVLSATLFQLELTVPYVIAVVGRSPTLHF